MARGGYSYRLLFHPALLEASIIRGRHSYRSLSSSITTTSPESTSPSRYEQLKARAWERWEESSGQREIDSLKQAVQQSSSQFDAAVDHVQSCRTAVEIAQKAHDDTHKVYANLLMRREQWDASDAASFVECTAQEVRTRTALTESRNALRKAEDDAGRRQTEYMNTMRQRYHEEQIWQEKWRMLGTYGTWTLIGLNTLVFMGSQIFHMQRESNRLKAIEQLIKQNLQEMQDTVSTHADNVDAALALSQHDVAERTADNQKEEREVIKSDSKSPSIDWIKAMKELDYAKVGQYIKDIDSKIKASVTEVHAPSVAVGAAASATCLLLVMIVTNRR